MRASWLGAALLILTACGSSAHHQVRYDVKAATSCIKYSWPSNVAVSRAEPAAGSGSFFVEFGDDQISTMDFVLVVGFGPDRASAIRREHLARSLLLEQYRHRRRAWLRNDGNVVYEALGPGPRRDPVVGLPPGKTTEDALREAHFAGSKMRRHLAACLEEARRD